MPRLPSDIFRFWSQSKIKPYQRIHPADREVFKRVVDGHCPLPFGPATGAFCIGTHHDASLAYPFGQLLTFTNGMADDANNTQQMIDALITPVAPKNVEKVVP